MRRLEHSRGTGPSMPQDWGQEPSAALGQASEATDPGTRGWGLSGSCVDAEASLTFLTWPPAPLWEHTWGGRFRATGILPPGTPWASVPSVPTPINSGCWPCSQSSLCKGLQGATLLPRGVTWHSSLSRALGSSPEEGQVSREATVLLLWLSRQRSGTPGVAQANWCFRG